MEVTVKEMKAYRGVDINHPTLPIPGSGCHQPGSH